MLIAMAYSLSFRVAIQRLRPVACLLLLGQAAWVRPALPTTAKRPANAAQRLDYLVVKVNDETHLVHDGEELSVMWGDKLEISEAVLVDRSRPITEVNVIGYKSPSPRVGEDRGYAFRTHQLKARFSEGKAGEVFVVLASSGDVLHGASYLRLVPPVLRYAEVKVNGASRLLRDGEELKVRAQDQFKVDRVVTNLLSNADVLFHVVPSTEPGHYLMQFERDRRVFASIPLKVTE